MIRLLTFLAAILIALSHPLSAAETGGTSTEGQESHEHHHDEDHEDGDDAHHAASAHGIRALHAWIQATTGKTALLFVEIDNGSDNDVVLTGGETDVAEDVELVGFQLKDGEADFVPLPSLPIKAGKELMLSPNGLALRLNGLTRSFKKGDEFEIEIEFDFGHIEMHAQVEAADATQHSHAGHQH